MKRFALAALAAAILISSVALAQAKTVTLTWTWPTARVDGSALALSAIGGFVVYDTSVPVPGLPGQVTPCTVTIPPTTATGTCTTGTLTPGTHGFVAVVSDNATPPDASAVSNAASAVIPFTGPAAITNLTATVNP
jgi:hypothetical protein